jgi:hypothetical protein
MLMRGIDNSPRAAGASCAAQGSVGGPQGGVAALAARFSGIRVQSAQNSTKGPVGALPPERLQVFQKDPKIVKVVELIKKVQQAIGEPIEGEPEYSSLFEETAIQTANDCIETLKELKQWIIDNRLLHGDEHYKADARKQFHTNPYFSELSVIKAATLAIANNLCDKLGLSNDDEARLACAPAITDNNVNRIQALLSPNLDKKPEEFDDNFNALRSIG